ncbi:hypothetical protein [Thioclava electrotropha]|uniref:Uncharacterized protein n=1 Tax=Thioclava electrotropha TaxID=1549850 RepID=A0ABX6YTN8_9RHOB|nr:hypothetical protein [Thioclava electrotropha]QPZ91053.1 hypothetical protein AKL02_009140 [Thioclava electrotropha]
MSGKRLAKLCHASIDHLLGDDKALCEQAYANILKEISSIRQVEAASPDEVTLELWYGVYLQFPDDKAPKTKAYLYRLLASSQSLTRKINEEGPIYLRELLRAEGTPEWRTWFNLLSQRLESQTSAPEDVSEALNIMGILGLAIVWILERVERTGLDHTDQKKYLQNYFEILFGEEEGRANPAKSVAKLLKYAFQESKLEKKSEFIHHAFGASESQVREAKRFFAGSAIPSYSQTIHALEVAIEMDEDDRKAWRWFVIIAQLIGRSSRRLEQLKTPIPNGQQPHAIYYEAMRTLLRERPASAMPSD